MTFYEVIKVEDFVKSLIDSLSLDGRGVG